MKKINLQNLHKGVFYLILILLPVNLGKHFITVDSYVRSRFVDFLIPTLWLQDLLILCLFIMWSFSGGLHKIKDFKYKHLFLIFLLSFLPSLIIAERFSSALYFYLTFVLRLFLIVYIWFEVEIEKELKIIIAIFSAQILFLVSLGLMQWFKQGSVFNNYLFFGEQVYNKSTFNIARTSLFGEQKIPAYSIFRHPNIFGGYLSILFIWILYYLKEKSRKFDKIFLQLFLFFVLTFAFFGIVITFSQFALFALILGILFYLSVQFFGKHGVLASIFTTALLFISSLFIGILSFLSPDIAQNPSVYRRVNLLYSSYEMIVSHPMWGVGINNFTVHIPQYLPLSQVLVFNQPVHNIFALIFSESGIFVLISFIAILLLCFITLISQEFGFPLVLFINLLQVIVLGSFDHYFYTIPQTQILFLLTIGLTLTYTIDNAKV